MPVPLAEQMYRYIMGQGGGDTFTGLLDTYPGAAAAYSVRKLSSTYTGSALRVRKEVSSVDEETDIGFDSNGDLDTTALLSFASDADGGNVYVTIWYDQSGNGNNATNSTESEQPLVVSGGTLVEENGKAAIDFEHSGTRTPLDLSSALSIGTNDFMIAAVVKNKTNQANNYIDSSTNGMDLLYIGNKPTLSQSGVGTVLQQTATVNNIDTFLINFLRHGGSVYSYLNGGSEVSATDSTDFSQQIDYIGDDEVIIQEIIIFDSDQSANLGTVTTGGGTLIQGNINTYFDIV